MSDHSRKQSIAAADQLFGTTDSSTDFFASVIGDSESAPDPAAVHAAPAVAQDADTLFDSTTGSDSLFDAVPGQDPVVHDAFDLHSEQGQQHADDTTYSEQTDYSQLGWYDEHGEWHYFDTQDAAQTIDYQTGASATRDASAAYGQQAFFGTTPDPYAPSYAPQQSAQAAPSSHYGYEQATSYEPTTDNTTSQYYAQNTYAPSHTTSSAYAPPAVQVPDPYAPSTAAYQPASAYGPYKPAATTATHSVAAAPSAYAPSIYAPSNYASTATPSYSSYAPPPVASVQTPAGASLSRDDTIKPRKVSVEQYRSPSYNAYDPPIPAVQPRSRITSTSPPTPNAAATGFNVYNHNASHTPPVAPPPPRSAAVHPPPPRATSALSARGSAISGQPPTASPQVNTVAPDPSGASFFASLQPPQQAYSLNSPGQPTQPLEPEVSQDAASYDYEATTGYSSTAVKVNGSASYATTTEDFDDPEGGMHGEGFALQEAQAHQSQSNAEVHEAYNAYAPRAASRAASIASPPPPRPSSVVSQPWNAPASRSASPAMRASSVASPPPRASSVVSPPPRATSVSSPPPRAPSVASIASQAASIHGRYAPSNMAASPPPHSHSGPAKISPQDPYAPKTALRRETSDYSPSLPSASPPQQFDPYRPRGASIVSLTSSKAASPPPPSWGVVGSIANAPNVYAPPVNGTSPYVPKGDPYAPSSAYAPQTTRREASEVSDYGDYSSRFGNGTQSTDDTKSVTSDTGGSVLNTATYAQYAPSPSLSGTNDPLGRASARVPLFSFGFGGKFVTCFHTPAGLTDGFDVSFSARPSTTVQIQRLHEIIPLSAWNTSSAVFPGPLLSDPGSPTASLVPPVRSNTSKAKKAAVLKYLEARIEESEKGLTYATRNSLEYHKSEGKLVLLRLLKVAVENDGQFSGSDNIESTVRAALLGDRAGSMATGMDSLRPADSFASAYGGNSTSEAPLAVYELRASALEKIQDFLMRGERRKAYHYALDEKMWAHALLLSNGLDKDAWKEAVQEFLRSELMTPPQGPGAASNGRESLRIMYSLIAGQGAASVQELVPPRALGQPRASESSGSLAAATPMNITPMTANFTQASIPANVPMDILSRWTDIAATIISNHVQGDSSGLTALGDTLSVHRWIEPAHACYLLSRSTSTISGCSNTSAARIVLLGSANPAVTHNFYKDQDPFIFSEILEFALSLAPAATAQDTFTGFAHLQAYRLLRALHLVEMGYDRLAQRYCDAIAATVRSTNRGSPFFTLTFLEQLKELSDRLVAAPQLDKGGSWLTKKMAKPSLDSLGTWLGGRLTDFIAGEDQAATPSSEVTAERLPPPSMGPFSHYSAISSTTSSASPSPPPQLADPNRASSALSFRSPAAPNIHVERASSAMDYLRPNANRVSPVPRIASANAATTTFSQAAGARYGHSPHAAYPSYPQTARQGSSDEATESQGQDLTVPWWGSSYGDDSGATPTAASFVRTEDPVESDTGGFISLMDTPSPAPSAAPSHNTPHNSTDFDDDDDDLGFGNSKKNGRNVGGSDQKPAATSKPAEKTPAPASSAKESGGESAKPAGGWISRLWGSKPSTPAPVKANLGEETSFYYDKELKRWVNKKAGATVAPATPPPPPPRAQTASPSLSRPAISTPPPPVPAGPPKFNRPASVADLALSSPPSGARPPRARSNLVPTDEDGAAGSLSVPGTPPPGAATPPMRPKSQASAKRNVRSRYVDVFQQSGGS